MSTIHNTHSSTDVCIGLVHARTVAGQDEDKLPGIVVQEYDTLPVSPHILICRTNRVHHHRSHALLGGGLG